MHVEVSVAVNFVISYLYNKLPRRRVDMLGEELDRCLKAKFQGHWYVDQPLKGTAYRCVRVSGEHPDNVMFAAARECGLDISEIFTYLPDELTLWIDPNEVSYRIGEKSPIKVLFSERRDAVQNGAVAGGDLLNGSVAVDGSNDGNGSSSTFNPEAQVFLPVSASGTAVTSDQTSQQAQQHGGGLMANFNHMSLTPSPTTSPQNNCWSASPSPTNSMQTVPYTGPAPVNSYLQKSISTPNFTAASFAQTKFGSTKLKSHSKRPNRLSPNSAELSAAAAAAAASASQQPMHMNGYHHGHGQHKVNSHVHHQQQHHRGHFNMGHQHASPSLLRSISLSPHEHQNYNAHYQQQNGQLDIPLLLPGRGTNSQTPDFLSLHIPTSSELMAMGSATSGANGPASAGSSSASSTGGGMQNPDTQTTGSDNYSSGHLLMAN